MIILTVLTIIQIIFLTILIIQITDLMRHNERLTHILDLLLDYIKQESRKEDDGR